MKAKTIKQVLRKKIDQWAKTIKDENVRALVQQHSIVTGGAIANMLLQEDVNDYDIYFENLETVRAVAKYYVDLFQENPPTKHKHSGEAIPIVIMEKEDHTMPEGVRLRLMIKSAGIAGEDGSEEYEYFEALDPGAPETEEFIDNALSVVDNPPDEDKEKDKGKYRPIFLTDNAITLSDDVQLVIRFYGPPDEIHKNYDFVHCTCSWHSGSGELRLPAEALECLLARELRYIGSRYPLASIIRTRKFIKRGFGINAGQYLKMMFQVSELDLSDPEVLEEQLIGVDVAYFTILIHAMKRFMEKKDISKMNYGYIAAIIDRIF